MSTDDKDKKIEEYKRLLKEKEQSSGLEYDIDKDPESNIPSDEINNSDTGRPTLGMAEKPQRKEESKEEGRKLASELGYHNINLNDLPSGGIFYPDNTEIAIKAARVKEIRHFSTMDENDPFDIDDKLNFIIQSCLKIRMGDHSGLSSWKDLKDEDRFYLIFAIRDLTFKDGENKLNINLDCKECSNRDKIELKNSHFNYYKIEDRMMEYFSDNEKCFDFTGSKIGNFKLYIPSLGVTTFIKKYITKKERNKELYDESFLKIAPFVFNDWRLLNDAMFKSKEQESYSWDQSKYSVIYKLVEKIRFGVKLKITKDCTNCGAEVTAPLMFPGGIKSLFIISDENLFDLL